ncbi:hypothetical protein NE848_14050 [Gramella jeungdoensis]|uniref:Uncharacterized protein n=1 Tax=Gramella jeungdoensis TaxID=708091 RepID=A0ABT0Z451_9FLAO|nr:hypothetical protein [Gramella jeungdoensis]MCM8570513.1 hypothetical protein [Gramella jeungdoensis]
MAQRRARRLSLTGVISLIKVMNEVKIILVIKSVKVSKPKTLAFRGVIITSTIDNTKSNSLRLALCFREITGIKADK